MPFTPGHAITAKDPTRVNARKQHRSLAMWIREKVDLNEIIDRLIMMSRGRDPASGEGISALDQQRAIQMLFDRGWGQAAQHVLIDADVRNEMIGSGPQIVKPTMTLEEINARREQLMQAGVQRRVIEAEAVPTTAAVLEDE